MEVGIVENEKRKKEMERGGYIISFCIFNYTFIYYCVYTQQYTVGLNKKDHVACPWIDYKIH